MALLVFFSETVFNLVLNLKLQHFGSKCHQALINIFSNEVGPVMTVSCCGLIFEMTRVFAHLIDRSKMSNFTIIVTVMHVIKFSAFNRVTAF